MIEIQKARVRALAAQVANYPHPPEWMMSCRTCLLHHATRIPFVGISKSRRGLVEYRGDWWLDPEKFSAFFGLPRRIPMLSPGGPTCGLGGTTGLHIATILLTEIGDMGPPAPVVVESIEQSGPKTVEYAE